MHISQLNILVIEDDAFQRKLITNMLRSLGAVNFSEAADGKQGLAVLNDLNAQPVDLVICDLNMPEMDGLEFLRHLSTHRQQPKAIIASALEGKLLSSAERMAKSYGIHMLGALPKPVTLDALKEMLARFGNVQTKWQVPESGRTFTLEEILQGMRDHQFEPYFQPKVDLRSGRLVGAEALARWVHPELGVITPYAFIPLLEKHGQIDALTFDMIKKSAAACRLFHENGYILTVAVNLSLTSLSDVALASKIIQLVRDARLDPHYIVLEITESAMMTDEGHALENLTRLCMHGFVLSIDDYGTGYSSMQQLTRIAFGELKIDQSFVTDCATNEPLRIVVESSIEMAHKLQVKSVAEGVETQQDWDLLKSMGCDTAQGYFIAKPLSQTDFREFIKSYKARAAPAKPQAKPHILVVDDDDFARRIIVRVLRDLGFDLVSDISSALTALKLLETQTFDLIVTDVDMPGMNGLEFAHLIRSGKTHAKANTRILLLTGHSNIDLLAVGMALDVNGFLVKPVIPAVLDEKITQALTEKMYLRPSLAYQSVMTKVHSLPSRDAPAEKVTHMGAAVVLGKTEAIPKSAANVTRIPLHRFRPGMIVQENIYAKDKTLLMRSGQVITEMSINRLNDLSGLINGNSFAVQEPNSVA
ncbi:phytochrome-like protein cph2 [mine drainage metagenome]|uniref:Phytochrome-like protein cph2 n=1 Tax=mine drainage metagenome TaxID=410659 RepID=A0A1J5RRW7_9ZZZZ